MPAPASRAPTRTRPSRTPAPATAVPAIAAEGAGQAPCADAQPTPLQHVMVLQGGGALGAYQGGVFEVLQAQGLHPDWMVGTSIGAINSAIIAGNPPPRRLQRLRAFWDGVARQATPLQWLAPMASQAPWLAEVARNSELLHTFAQGIPGFFRPRGLVPFDQPLPSSQASFYDTSPLRETLLSLVDFDYLNAAHVRCTVCAVNVADGELAIFDNTKHPLTPEHIMASGALPPGFPAVIIDGQAYWDGGIYSNTPLDIVMADAERRNTLCFMIDLWDPTEDVPSTIRETLARQKDIQYASRTREHLEDHRRMQNMRHAIRALSHRLARLGDGHEDLQDLAHMGCDATINVVRLIMKALPHDDHNKDVDFSRVSLQERWQAGQDDAKRTLAHPHWLQAPAPNVGMVIHELPQI